MVCLRMNKINIIFIPYIGYIVHTHMFYKSVIHYKDLICDTCPTCGVGVGDIFYVKDKTDFCMSD